MTDERSISSSTSSQQQPLTPLSQQSKATVSSLVTSNLIPANLNSSQRIMNTSSPRPTQSTAGAAVSVVYQTPTTTSKVSDEATTTTAPTSSSTTATAVAMSIPRTATAPSSNSSSSAVHNTATASETERHLNHSSNAANSNRSNTNPAVLLGIETLERQQEEFERKRRMNMKSQGLVVERHNPFDHVEEDTPPPSSTLWDPIAAITNTSNTTTEKSSRVQQNHANSNDNLRSGYHVPGPTPPTLIRSSRWNLHPSQPQDHHHPPAQIQEDHIPSTVHHLVNGGSEVDDEITMESSDPYPTTTAANLRTTNPKTTTNLSNTDPTLKKGHLRSSSFGSFATKFFKTPMKQNKRTISDDFRNDPTPQSSANNKQIVQPILFGYLHKLGRNGKWQKRWFESDGTSLFYFKSSARTQILATLDLLRVGMIHMDYSDSSGCTFMIEVAGRSYYLCADTKERARDWVITLNRVKEARMKVGGLRIVQPTVVVEEGGGLPGMVRRKVNGVARKNQPSSDGSRNEDSDSDEDPIVSARVITTGSRPRTKGLGKSDFQELEQSLEDESASAASGLFEMGKPPPSPMAGTGSLGSGSPKNMKLAHSLIRNSSVPNVNSMVAVRWRKERSKMQNIVRRLSRWAKRITMIRCVIQNHVVHFDPKNDMYEYHEELQDRRVKKREEDASHQMSTDTVRMYSDPYSLEKRVRPTSRIEQPSLSGSESGRISPNIGDDASGIIA